MKGVLPAYAGMILQRQESLDAADRAPRVCGDDPGLANCLSAMQECSPRMRG